MMIFASLDREQSFNVLFYIDTVMELCTTTAPEYCIFQFFKIDTSTLFYY
ncbi:MULTISPECIES: hypothetical protein [Bacillus cereus group]|nr:hypothetical protein [Bacillus cereus]MDA2490975.1 hypothetical protein [Bacillus cereus]MDZ4619130.1 hypothetical protein [Bacillus cereus]MEB8704639.1 hypothetical protein [Bacillus cereus]